MQMEPQGSSLQQNSTIAPGDVASSKKKRNRPCNPSKSPNPSYHLNDMIDKRCLIIFIEQSEDFFYGLIDGPFDTYVHRT